MKKALVTGILGQDGSYIAEYLLSLGYEVHGVARGIVGETGNYVRGVVYHVGDMRDELALENIVRKVWPSEIYNLAGQVFVPTSWTNPDLTFDVNTGGLARVLKIVDRLELNARVYQASSSEMYGNIGGALDERAPMVPVSPYGVSKLAAHQLVHVYREKGMFVVAGVLFNHESPRRSEHMVTRKITRAVAAWACGDDSVLELGDVKASRDWGFAGDYVKAMHKMLQHSSPDDYVVGTGETHTVLEFLTAAIKAAGLDHDRMMKRVRTNTKVFNRRNELLYLRADPVKARIILKWKPTVGFEELVEMMVKSDIDHIGRKSGAGRELAMYGGQWG